MHAIDSGKEKVKGMKPVVDGFGDGRSISGDAVFFRMCRSATSEAAITSFGHILRHLILRNFFIFYQVCIHR